MADIDKEGLMSMLGGLIGDDKKGAVESLMNSFSDSKSETDTSQYINTAELMTKMTRVMDKLNRTKDNREFQLLSAIRPYMKGQRQGRLDSCLKMLQVVNVMNELKKE